MQIYLEGHYSILRDTDMAEEMTDFSKNNILMYAMDYCIEHNVMKELLLKHKAEVARLIFREFDEAEYMRQLEREKEATIAAYKEKIALQEEQISQKDKELLQKAEQLAKYKLMLEEHGIILSEE